MTIPLHEKPYRGAFRAVAGLEVGGRMVFTKPDGETKWQFIRRVQNGVADFGRTRRRKFKTRMTILGDVEVIRVMSDAEQRAKNCAASAPATSPARAAEPAVEEDPFADLM